MIFSRDDVIPYGPFLCLGSLVVVVRWTDFWTLNIQDIFQYGWLIAVVLAVSFAMLGVMLAVWQQIKMRLFGYDDSGDDFDDDSDDDEEGES